jgi:ABC-type transport system involved in cytochrome c biogenesis permease subunit
MIWYLIPVSAAVSLVWNASRYEDTAVVLKKAGKLYLQILLFMGCVLGVLMLLSYRL